MKQGKSPTFCLVAAIIWTLVALFVMYVLFFGSTAGLLAKVCGMVLIIMCVVGQWLRFFKSR